MNALQLPLADDRPAGPRTAAPTPADAAREGAHHVAANIKVLMYHGIVDDERLAEKYWSLLHVGKFRDHLDCLDRWGFTPITFHDVELHRRGLLSLPARPVILTFDDGYESTYRLAVPLLREFGMTAAFFVLGDRKIRTNYWDSAKGWPELPLVGRNQILDMRRDGFEIGSHSLSHRALRGIPEDSAWTEIAQSRGHLELLLGEAVASFAYPYGSVDRTAKRLVREAGYSFACSVSSGPASFLGDDFEIRRITMHHRIEGTGLAVRLLFPYQRYLWARHRLRTAVDQAEEAVKGAMAFVSGRPKHGRPRIISPTTNG